MRVCPSVTSKTTFKLGQWVTVQRVHRATISAERRDRLEELPDWSWDAREDGWNAAYECLVKFVAEHSHARVPAKTKQDGFALGRWVSGQRTSRATISAERRDRLEELQDWSWDARRG